MAYVGVEFSEDGLVGLVHSSWLTPLKREVFWPPYKTTKSFNKSLVTAEEPDESSWRICCIKRTFFECDNIDIAKKKLKKCEETSDIVSSETDFESKKKKRKITKRKIFSDSESSGSEDEGSAKSCQVLKRPPVFSPLPKTSKPDDGFIPGYGDSITQPRVQHLSNNINVTTAGLEKIFQEIKKLQEDNKEIKALLKQSRNSVAANLPEDIPVEFPLENVETFNVLEDYLNTNEKINDLACYLASLGGTGTTAQVNRILRFAIRNILAVQYNFAGQRNGKRAFGDTKLKSAIIRAVQIKSPATTQVEVENALKIWLKHAKQRMTKESAKN